jgi:cell division protein FtsB
LCSLLAAIIPTSHTIHSCHAALFMNGQGNLLVAPLSAVSLSLSQSLMVDGVDVLAKLRQLEESIQTLGTGAQSDLSSQVQQQNDTIQTQAATLQHQATTLEEQAALLTQLRSDLQTLQPTSNGDVIVQMQEEIAALQQQNTGLRANLTAAAVLSSSQHAASLVKAAALQSQIDAVSNVAADAHAHC